MIAKFNGEYRFLSNFHPAEVMLDGEIYLTVEHAYQAAKTLVYSERDRVRIQPTPGKAKRVGRTVPLRNDWDNIKVPIMFDLVRQKFAPGTELAEKLLATGDEWLVEGNHWHDTFWGKCVCGRHDGEGSNMLGHILMQIRRELREQAT